MSIEGLAENKHQSTIVRAGQGDGMTAGGTEDDARERLVPEGRKGHIWVFRHRKKPGKGRRGEAGHE
ncbi:MAG: hypothetical protein Q7J68_06595 [Thermoplasmata archaeon]|nr:hypothetical protein [Thermoplasmata archaeon]